MTRPPNVNGHARPGIFVTRERARGVLSSANKKVTKALGLVIGQNTKALSSDYLTQCMRNTMTTVMTEFAEFDQARKQT